MSIPIEELKKLKRYGVAEINTPGYRPDTRATRYLHHYLMNGGGLGDYINYMSTFLWMNDEIPHIKGHIYVRPPFLEVAQWIMRDAPNWTVYDENDAKKVIKIGSILHNPAQFLRYINATGAHLMDVGSMYYCALDRLPESHRYLPDLTDYESGKDWGLPERYAVMTPGYTVMNRAFPPTAFNKLSNYLLDKGITPVYMGKKDFATAVDGREVGANYHTKFPDELDLTNGIDLREKTTLLEATEIMAKAKLVLGVDNGLLHFAGCTTTPIIFGHTITAIKDRIIRRKSGITIDIENTPEELACAGCQSRMRELIGHNFKKCYYDDYLCLDALFDGGACTKWIQAIDQII